MGNYVALDNMEALPDFLLGQSYRLTVLPKGIGQMTVSGVIHAIMVQA
jgi:hypothetical protein